MYFVMREPQVGEKNAPVEGSNYAKPVVNFFDDSEENCAQEAYERACEGIGSVVMAKLPFDELWELANVGIKWEDVVERPECIFAHNTVFDEKFLWGKDNGDSENSEVIKALTFAGWFKKNEKFMSRYERAVIEVRNNFEGYGEVAYTTKPENIYILLQIFGEYEMSKVQVTGDENGPCFRFVLGVDLGKKLDTRESWI